MRIGRVFFGEKRNSSAEWETDSKPAKAQGARNTMNSTPAAGEAAGEKAGCRFGVIAVSGLRNTLAKPKSTPPMSSRPMRICRTEVARFPASVTAPKPISAARQTRISPR